MSPRNRDEALAPDEEINDVDLDFDTDTDAELSGFYEQGFRAGDRDARESTKTDNPFALDTLPAAHELWQDGYEDGT
jgi:hypothetical protein